MTDEFDRNILFCRMIGFLTQQDLDSLTEKTIAVGGAGGVGFTHAECLVRQGIGRIRIADLDTFGPENMGRQFGCTVNTVGRDKAQVLEERLLAINPALKIERFGGLDTDNIGRFLEGADFVCDAVDYFNICVHRLLHGEARRRRIPVMFVGPQGYGCTAFLFDPDHMSLDEYFDFRDGMTEKHQFDNWGTGLGPAHLYRHYMDHSYLDMEKKTTSIVSSVCLLATAILGAVVLRKLLNQPVAFKPVPYTYHLDLAMFRFEEILISGGVNAIREQPEKYLR